MAMPPALAQFYIVEVRKACGKKKPEIQKTMGVPLSNQFWRKEMRSIKSSIQLASGFMERMPILPQ